MPIIDKRDRNNWYNSIRVDSGRPVNQYTKYLEHPETFDVEKLQVNEFDMGNGQVVAKIPKIPGRITRFRKNENSSEYFIQLITGQTYDREKKQGRNEKVTIGTDISWHLPGMMLINEKYHEYFDKEGKLFNDPMIMREKKPKKKTQEQTDKPGSDSSGETESKSDTGNMAEQDNRSDRAARDTTAQFSPQTPEPKKPTEEQMLEELKQKKAILDQKISEQERLNEDLRKVSEEYQKAKEELDSIRMVRIVQLQTAEMDRISFLSDILEGQRDIVVRQAGKNPYVPMSLIQIRMINEILAELKRIFSGVEGEEYLKLAEEPRMDPDDEKKEIPGATYGEMSFILQAYNSMIHACNMKRLRYRDE